VLTIGSGSITHNLGEWSRLAREHAPHPEPQPPAPYVVEFRDAIEAALRAGDLEFLADYRERAPHARRAHPTDEHFLPLLVAFAAADPHPQVERVDLGVDGGVIGMDAFIIRPSDAPA